MMTDAMANDTAAAIATPMKIRTILFLGAIAMKAMIDPGEAGPFRPQPVMRNHVIAQMFPTIGAMITTGFISTYGK